MVHVVPHDVPHLGVFPPIIYKNKGIKVRQMFFRGAQKSSALFLVFTLYGLVCGFSSSFVLTQKKNETRRKSQGCVCEATAERPDRRSKRNSLRSDSVSPLPPDSSLRLTPLRRGRSFYAKALRCLREWLGERNAAILRPEEFFLRTGDFFLCTEDEFLRTEIFYGRTLLRFGYS